MPHIELRCEWHFGNCSIWIMRDQCRFIKREDHRTKHISFSVRNWKDKKCLRPQRTKAKKNIKKSEKALSQADFPENPVISFSVLQAISSGCNWFQLHPLCFFFGVPFVSANYPQSLEILRGMCYNNIYRRHRILRSKHCMFGFTAFHESEIR